MKRLEQDYFNGLVALKNLFTAPKVSPKIDRLNDIYNLTEQKWEENVQRLGANNTKVKYVVIGEAAPYSDSGDVSYFYNKCESNWCKRITSAFFYYSPDPLTELAKNQFLLIDSMPFAMKYSTNDRKKTEFDNLLKHSFSYFDKKIKDPRLQWAEDIKVAFAVQYHAYAFWRVCGQSYTFPSGQTVTFENNQIAIDGTNYPSPQELRRVFALIKQ